jgi:hypothetical protein
LEALVDADVKAWLLAELGTATDLVDLETRYTRLGTARAVALEVLRERLAALRAQPSTVNVSGVVGVGFTENIRAYERQIAALEAGEPPAPDDPDDGSIGGGLGIILLRERPRR